MSALFWLRYTVWAHSSAGERSLHTREVPGSIPGAPTRRIAANRHFPHVDLVSVLAEHSVMRESCESRLPANRVNLNEATALTGAFAALSNRRVSLLSPTAVCPGRGVAERLEQVVEDVVSDIVPLEHANDQARTSGGCRPRCASRAASRATPPRRRQPPSPTACVRPARSRSWSSPPSRWGRPASGQTSIEAPGPRSYQVTLDGLGRRRRHSARRSDLRVDIRNRVSRRRPSLFKQSDAATAARMTLSRERRLSRC